MKRSPRLSRLLAPFSGRRNDPRPGSVLARIVLVVLVGAYFAAGLGYLGLRWYVWPRLDDWRPQLTQRIGQAVGRPVTIERIDTGFEGLRPRLVVHTLRIDDDDGEAALLVPHATAVVALKSFFTGELHLSVLQLDAPLLRVERVSEGRLRVAGVEVPLEGEGDGSALEILLGQRRVLLRDARVEWIDRVGDRRERFDAIDVSLGSVGRRHRGVLTVAAPGPGWQRAQFAFEIYRAAGGGAADSRGWTGEAFVGVDGFDAAQARALSPVPVPVPLAAAIGDFKGWITFDGGRPKEMRLKLAAQGVEWRTEEGPIRLASVETDLGAKASGDGYAMRASILRASADSGFALAAAGEQTIEFDAQGRPTSVRASLAGFDAAGALAFARELPLPAATRERLAPLQVSGRISSLVASWGGPSAAGAAHATRFDATFDFERLSLRYAQRASGETAGSVAPSPNVPWFETLSGEARIGSEAGELRVRSGRSAVAFPGIFAEPVLAFDSLRADASWRIDRSGDAPAIAVEVAELRFANADAAGTMRGKYRTGGKGPGIVDLAGRIERAEANRVVRYLPLQIEQPVRDWIGESIRSGKLDEVRFAVKGDLWNFPFRDPSEGEFSIVGRLSDGTLAYSPDWPAIERFQGQLAFERAGMRIDMRSGRVFDVALGSTQATIRDFAQPLLRVEGSGEGPASDLIRFVNESPVATRIDDFTRDTVARGNAKLALKLDLPIGDLERTRVACTVQFLGNDLRLDNTIPPLGAVSGALEFSEQGLALRGINATFLGGPLRVVGETPEPGRFVIRAEGAISAQGMRSVVDNALTRALDGRTAYTARIELRHRAAAVRIDSDLEGLSSSLPEPLRKAASARWPLRVETTPEIPRDADARPQRDRIDVALGERIRLALERERDRASERLLIRRGSLSLDAQPVLQDAGLSLVINAKEVDVDTWLPLLAGSGGSGNAEAGGAAGGAAGAASGAASGGSAGGSSRAASGAAPGAAAPGPAQTEFAEGFSLLPSFVSVVASKVDVGGRTLHDVVFGASRAEGFWRANISAREVNGYFNWRDPGPGQRIGTLTARFARLEIPRSRAREFESLLDTSPSELPALDIAAEEFVLFDRRLGKLQLRATNSASSVRPGWRLDELRIVSDAAEFKAHGSWAQSGASGRRTTQLLFDLGLKDSGKLLETYGLDDVVRGGAGKVTGTVRWNGSPLAIDYPSLGGDIELAIGKGRFLKTDPGIAKLIGVLNLQSLPRRLTLDFSDVFAEGFAFDEIAGDVAIERGVARTGNLVMRGPQALVRISGQANIERETQALTVEVRPELNAGLASLAGAIINPAIGIGSFLAQLALRGQIQQIFSYEYDVRGSWADPQVIDKRRSIEPSAPNPTP